MNYGFDNFTMVNLSENDNTYSIKNPIFYTTSSPFGKSETLIEMDKDAYILIPVNASFEDTESSIVFDNLGKEEYARIDYYLRGTYVGSACIVPTKPASRMFDFFFLCFCVSEDVVESVKRERSLITPHLFSNMHFC